jgi:anti-sigma-K factor RskA
MPHRLTGSKSTMPTNDQLPNDPRTPASGPEADDVILSEETAIPGDVPSEAVPNRSLHDLAAAYVLDALSQEERTAYEAHLADCAECQARIAGLRRVADLLPNALIVPPSELPDAYPFLLRDVAHETLPFSSTFPTAETEPDDEEGAEPPLAESEPEQATEDSESPAITPFDEPEPVEEDASAPEVDEPEPLAADADTEFDEARDDQEPFSEDDDEPLEIIPARPVRQPRPPGRIRPGVRPSGGPATTVAPQRIGVRATPTVIGFSLLGLVAIGLFLWALLLQGRINDLENERDDLNAQLAEIRLNANATSYTLVPTTNGPPAATGTFFFSLPDQRGALTVRGLTAAPDGQTYQIWYIDDDEEAPISGPPFTVNSQGEAAVPLNLNATTFDGIAISLEPASLSNEPTTPYLLQGQLGGAAG